MSEHFPFHVIDVDSSRRATIARELYSRRLHAEIYQDIEELIARAPQDGAVLIADDETAGGECSVEIIRSSSGYLPVAYFCANPSPQMIVRAMRLGATDYLQWPFSSDALDAVLARLQQQAGQQANFVRRQTDARL